MAAADTHDAPDSRTTRGTLLPRSRTAWPTEAQAAHRDLLRRLDSACRDDRLAPRDNDWIADRAVREVWEKPTVQSPSRPDSPTGDHRTLHNELRCWPSRWRYRVAGLERSGCSRETAVRLVRTEHSRQMALHETANQQAA